MYLNEDNFREDKDKIVLKKNKDKIKQNTRSVNILLLLYMSLYGYWLHKLTIYMYPNEEKYTFRYIYMYLNGFFFTTLLW